MNIKGGPLLNSRHSLYHTPV